MTKDLPVLSDEQIKKLVPLQRQGNGDDIAGVILYLASKVRPVRDAITRLQVLTSTQAGSYVNGDVHLVDGGRLMLYPSSH